MKTINLFVAIIVQITYEVNSQWQSDFRLTNDPAVSQTSHNSVKSIVESDGNIHVVWVDGRSGSNSEIFYKRSADRGLSWEQEKRLSDLPDESLSPSISVSGQSIHVVWSDSRNAYWGLYYKRSTDNGVTWGADTRLSMDLRSKEFPSVVASGLLVHVSWDDWRDTTAEIYYKRSTDGGVTWSADLRLTNSVLSSRSNSMTTSGPIVHIAWHDWRNGVSNPEIYYKRSTNGGLNWSTDFRLTNNSTETYSPSIAAAGSNVYIVWDDFVTTGNSEIYFRSSTDNGVNWGNETRLTNNSASSEHASLIAEPSGLLHIAWTDRRDGNEEIYYKRSLNMGANWDIDVRLTNNAEDSYNGSICSSGPTLNIVWTDTRDGNLEIYYKQNPTGNVLGIIKVDTEIPNHFSLSQNYPNPFNPTTNFEFSIPLSRGVSEGRGVFVNLTIYDVMGRAVETLQNGEMKPGVYKADWNASGYPSGVYFYKLSNTEFSETKKMILIK